MSPLIRYAGRVVLVTGAASGIGRAVVLRLIDEQATVIAVDRSIDGLSTLADEFAPLVASGRLRTGVADVTDAGALRNILWDNGVETLDGLVHCAGIGDTRRSSQTSDEDWDRVVGINLTGAWRTVRTCLPALIAGRGAVVVISSIAGIAGRPYLAAYSAAKGGLIAMVRSLAVEHAGDGVRFNCVAPGSVDTPLKQDLHAPSDADEALLGRGRSLLEQASATPEDIAAAVAYLAAPEARFVTGSVLVIDGGALA